MFLYVFQYEFDEVYTLLVIVEAVWITRKKKKYVGLQARFCSWDVLKAVAFKMN